MKIGWDHIHDPGLFRTGDIGHLRGRSEVIGPGIRWFSTHTGERPSFANHTFMITTPARFNAIGKIRQGAEIIEAEDSGVNINLLSHYRDRADIVITRVRALSEHEERTIQMEALRYHKMKYPFAKIGLHAIQRLIKPTADWIGRLSFLRNPYCNQLVALCYERIGLAFGRSPDIQTPDDMLDFQIKAGHEIVWISGPEALRYLEASYPGRFVSQP